MSGLGWVLVFLGALLGLSVGSFANVVVHRVPAGRSVLAPRSACPACGSPVAARDNVPVLSWLMLGGRCRNCRAPISWRYPLVELATAAAFVAVSLRFGAAPAVPAYWVLAAACVMITAIDLEHYRVPVKVLYPAWAIGAVALVAASLLGGGLARLVHALLGAALSFAVLFVLHLISPRGMGFGDVRLAGFLGMFLGWLSLAQVGVGLFLAFALGSVVGLALVAAGARSMRSRLPFAPFLCAGSFIAVLWGNDIVRIWLG